MLRRQFLLLVSSCREDAWASNFSSWLTALGTVTRADDTISLEYRHVYDLILVDEHFPDPYFLISRLRVSNPRAKFVLFYSAPDWENIRNGLRRGVDDFGSKHWEKEELLAYIKHALAYGPPRGKPSNFILLADNDREYLKSTCKILQLHGFSILPAISVEEAEQAVRNWPISLAILDKRLEDDDDQNDTTGIQLGKRLKGTPKIVLTRFPSPESVREAMAFRERDQNRFWNYIDKAAGMHSLVETIDQTLTLTRPPDSRTNWSGRPYLYYLFLTLAMIFGVAAVSLESISWLYATLASCAAALSWKAFSTAD